MCSPPGWPTRISGAGADAYAGVHRMPGTSPRVNSRSRTPSSRRCSEVNRMVVPFGSALERRSRTTYRPTVTPGGSTHIDTFTGTTSSCSGAASGKVPVVAVVRQQVLPRLRGSPRRQSRSASKIQRNRSRSLDKCREQNGVRLSPTATSAPQRLQLATLEYASPPVGDPGGLTASN